MHIDRLFLRFAAIAALATALSCGDSDERRAEQALLTADSEEGGVQGLLSLNYEITSDVFKKWKTAQLGLDRALGKSQSRSLKAYILGERPTREAIERSVARIEGNAGAKRAIQDAGMSPRHYVVATVALFQATRGIDPVTGEAFRGLPARNVEFAAQNREEIETREGEGEGEFQQIADSIAAARAASEGMRADTMIVRVDTVQRPVPLPAPIPVPTPTPTPVPQPAAPTPPTTPGATGR